MGILRKMAAWGVVALAALVVVFFAMPMYRQGEPTVAGKKAQDFPLEIAGKPGHLTDLKGKVVVLNFWATWCPPWVEETPALNKLQKYIDSRGGMVLGVSVDEDPAAYEKFLKDQGVIFPTFREPTGNSHSSTAPRCTRTPTSLTGTGRLRASSSAPNSGIRRICAPTSTQSSAKPNPSLFFAVCQPGSSL